MSAMPCSPATSATANCPLTTPPARCSDYRLASSPLREIEPSRRENGVAESGQGLPRGEALYWMAEKLAWGYDDVQQNYVEALKLFRQAADLGFTDAYIRIGELQEHGKGTELDPGAAVKSYQSAAAAGNFLGYAYLAKLLSRTKHLEHAEKTWDRFFAALSVRTDYRFVAAQRGELLYDYITSQLRLGLEPEHVEMLQRYRIDIAGHHQRILEHARDDQLDRLDGPSKWIELHLGPWPTQVGSS
jgi:TPR repeat protein